MRIAGLNAIFILGILIPAFSYAQTFGVFNLTPERSSDLKGVITCDGAKGASIPAVDDQTPNYIVNQMLKNGGCQPNNVMRIGVMDRAGNIAICSSSMVYQDNEDMNYFAVTRDQYGQ